MEANRVTLHLHSTAAVVRSLLTSRLSMSELHSDTENDTRTDR